MPSLERSRGGQAEMDGLSSLGLNPGLGLNTRPVRPDWQGGGHVAPSRNLRRGEAKS